MSSEDRETRQTNESLSESLSSSTDEQKVNEWGQEGYIPNRDEQSDADLPTLMLDVPVLNVDEINLEVSDLRAHVSLRTELADLVKINVGLDIYLDKVQLDIKGLEAQALLKVRLDQVLGTLNRALDAVDKNPQILDGLVSADPAVGGTGPGASQSARDTEPDADMPPRRAEDATGQVGEAAQRTGDVSYQITNETEQAAGSPLDDTSEEESRPVQWAADGSGNATGPGLDINEAEGDEPTGALAGLQIEEEYIDERGRIVGRARDGSGNVVEGVLDEEGRVSNPSVPEEVGDLDSEDDGEVDATDAARRKADELGVKLSEVQGTGSNGRVLVKDVERAAK
ncbi:MAG: E3 binding domain-containing protein [Actinomycetota bacterium]|nr:E3 binding domain-containing protein [Actinomycetota bacterium]